MNTDLDWSMGQLINSSRYISLAKWIILDQQDIVVDLIQVGFSYQIVY